MKWLLGIGLVALCGGIGVQAGGVLHRRRKGIHTLVFALDLLNGEIAYSMTPLRRAFYKIAAVTEGPVQDFFTVCARRMEAHDQRLTDIWREELQPLRESLPLGREEVDSLLELGAVLGKNDQENQKLALDRARMQLQSLLEEARQKEREGVRLYRSLGVAAGVFLALLLW
ncbi:MAG: stage III sporulation protein AB [Eubacteriales bacterium]